MLGPMFLLEWKYAARRSRHFQFRAYYTLLVVAEFVLFLWGWLTRSVGPWAVHAASPQLSALAAADYLPLFLAQHLLLLLFVTPALACGSVSDEKARGTFPLLLITRLTPAEIVMAKWLGQTVQMLVLALPAVPFIAFLLAMSGAAPAVVGAWVVESVLLTMLLAALDLLASVVAHRTATAIAIGYLVLLAGLWVAWWPDGEVMHQLALTAPLARPTPHDVSTTWMWLMLAAGSATLGCLALAAGWFRRACLDEDRPRHVRRPRWLARPAVSDAPMRWKERHVGELGVLAFARQVPRWAWLGLTLTAGVTAALFLQAGAGVFTVLGIAMIVLVGLLVAIRSSGAITRERELQTWEGLLITPLDPYTLVRGKLWGIIDSIKPYLLAYFVAAMIWSLANGWLAAACTTVSWFAAWGFLYFQAANGLHESARSPNSLRALVYALGTGGTAILSGAALPVIVVLALTAPVIGGPGFVNSLGIMLLILVALICALMFSRAEVLLLQAEQHIAEQERIVQDRGRWRDALYRYEREANLARR